MSHTHAATPADLRSDEHHAEERLSKKATHDWNNDAQMFEYTAAANPDMPSIPIVSFPASLHESGETRLIALDLSEKLKTPYPATSPNLLANFIRINPGESFSTRPNATSQLFYIIRGEGKSASVFGDLTWSEGDVFTLPAGTKAVHQASSDVAIYFMHDAPLLSYLGVAPVTSQFAPSVYRKVDILAEVKRALTEAQSQERNRNGVLLANRAMSQTLSLTHTLWSLYNTIPAKHIHAPHRHNSVAIDLCLSAKENVFTAASPLLDSHGKLVDAVKCYWKPGEVFITPPGLWHAHHNESDDEAWVLPTQDAGLYTYQRTLDIRFAK
jgi:gentisate 1,2-dioxygenase